MDRACPARPRPRGGRQSLYCSRSSCQAKAYRSRKSPACDPMDVWVLTGRRHHRWARSGTVDNRAGRAAADCAYVTVTSGAATACWGLPELIHGLRPGPSGPLGSRGHTDNTNPCPEPVDLEQCRVQRQSRAGGTISSVAAWALDADEVLGKRGTRCEALRCCGRRPFGRRCPAGSVSGPFGERAQRCPGSAGPPDRLLDCTCISRAWRSCSVQERAGGPQVQPGARGPSSVLCLGGT